MIYQPYTYFLVHVPTGKKYYGVQYRTSGKVANPKNLWNVYFSSSKEVHDLINDYGKESFKVEIRKTFETREDAVKWERKVLRRLNVVNKSDWINRCVWDTGWILPAIMPDHVKAKIGAANKGKVSNNKGKKFTEEHKRKIRESNKKHFEEFPRGKPTEEHRKKNSDGVRESWASGKLSKRRNNSDLRI